MENNNFTVGFLVDQTPAEVFKAVNNVREWWSESIDGSTDQLNSEWKYSYEDVHRCKIKIVELVPNQKVVWLVTDNYFNFTKDKSEWINTKLIFEISTSGNQTKLHFTHQGLVPAYECYEVCNNAWTGYITKSLRNLIATGQGNPNKGSEITSHEKKQ